MRIGEHVACFDPTHKTSLDPDETYVRLTDGEVPTYDARLKDTYSAFRHSGWRAERARTLHALKSAWMTKSNLSRFQGCGTNAKVFRHRTDGEKYQIRSNKCRNRWCIPCAKERGRAIARTLSALAGPKQIRFITLTLRTTDQSLSDSVKLLTNSFRRLRHSTVWRETQRGGAAFMEVKWNPERHRWHPHLHILAEGKYIPKQQLSKSWCKATGGSFIVDVRLVASKEQLCSYVTKYVACPVTSSIRKDRDRLVEAVAALHGKRTCATFGTWRGTRLTPIPEVDEWVYVGTYQDFARSASINPWGEKAHILRAMTTKRHHDLTTPEQRGPPSSNRNEQDYDYHEMEGERCSLRSHSKESRRAWCYAASVKGSSSP